MISDAIERLSPPQVPIADPLSTVGVQGLLADEIFALNRADEFIAITALRPEARIAVATPRLDEPLCMPVGTLQGGWAL